MPKKVCCEVVVSTIYLFLTACLSVVDMTLLLLLVVTIMKLFLSDFCEKKTFVTHIFLVRVRG